MKKYKSFIMCFLFSFMAVGFIPLDIQAGGESAPGLPQLKVSLGQSPAACVDSSAGLKSGQDIKITAACAAAGTGKLSYKYSWYKNHVLQEGITGDTLPKEQIAKGQVWRCEVTPFNGETSGPSAVVEFNIINSAPEFIDKSAKTVVVAGRNAQISVKAADADNDYLTYNDPELPAGVTLDRESRVLTFPAAEKGGNYNLNFSVSDGEVSTSQSMGIVIISAMEGTDLNPYMPPVGDQGSLGSCASWATGYYYKSFQEGKEKNWDMTSLAHRCSPAFLYNQQVQGNGNSGTSFEGNFEILKAQGCASLNAMSYSGTSCTLFPNQAQYQDGMPFRAQEFEYLGNPPDLTVLRQHLDTGDIFVIGVPVYADYLSATGGNDVHDGYRTNATLVGYHAISVVGYDDNREYTNAGGIKNYGAFKFVNSWGSTWSTNGYSWLSYNFVANYDTWAYRMTDRIGYWVKAMGSFHITHPRRKDLIINIGVGASTTSPVWQKTLFSLNGAGSVADIDASVDLTDKAALFPPSAVNKWFVGMRDYYAGNTGTLTSFTVSSRSSSGAAFETSGAKDVPIAVPDAGSTVYSYISESQAIPGAPSGLSASVVSATQVNLSWTDNSGNESGFKVERKTGAAGSWSVVATLAANTAGFSNTGLASGEYYYRVFAYNANGESSRSNEVLASLSGTPAAPSMATASVVTNSLISLGWQDNSGNESGFKVERNTCTNGTCQWVLIGSAAANATTYNDSSMSGYGTHCYRIYAYNQAGNSGYSEQACAVTVKAPSNLKASAANAHQINLSWTADSSTQDGFRIERKTGAAGTWALIATAAKTALTFCNTTNITAGETYYYRIQAYAATAKSDYSNEAGATTLGTPSGLTVSLLSGQLTLNWSDNAANEANYHIFCKQGATGTYSEIAKVGANVSTWSDANPSRAVALYYKVQCSNPDGVSDFSAEVSISVPQLPAAPSNLTAQTASSAQINLSWSDNSADETGFKVEKSNDNITFNEIASLSANAVSYSATGLNTAATYYFRVRAFNNGGNSAYSNIASAATSNAGPNAPSDLAAAAASSTQINLSWADNADNETGFRVESSSDGNTFKLIASLAADSKSYSVRSLTSGISYYFRVRSYNSQGSSAYSNVAQSATLALPVAPTGLTATAALASQIKLAWEDNSADETGFRVERKLGDTGTWTAIATVKADVTSYTNSSLTAESTYFYRVRALRGTDYSSYSNEAQATTLPLPAAPSGLTVASVLATQVKLSWTDNSSDETGFRVERKLGDAGTWTAVATVKADVTSYSSNGLTAESTYFYRVRTVRSVDYSLYSNEAQATTLALPAAPSGLTATAALASQVKLAWTDNSADETGFRVERKLGEGGTWTAVATLAANITSYTSSGLVAESTYFYRVRTIRSVDYSLYSNEAQATTLALPAAPSGLTVTSTLATQIKLSWTDNSADETAFRVERKLGESGTWAAIATVKADVTACTSSGLSPESTYFYRVRAIRVADYSLYSNEAQATTLALPAAPSGVSAVPVLSSQIKLTWTDNSADETGFRIERKTGEAGTWVALATAAANATSYLNSGLTANTAYYYRIRTVRSPDYSLYSNEAQAATLELPAAPSGLSAAVLSSTQAKLSWADNSGDETAFRIERKTADGNWTYIASVAANVTTYTNAGLKALTGYSYRVRALRVSDYSAYSQEAAITTMPLPEAPSGVTASSLVSRQVKITWTDNSSDETSFRIERKTGDTGSWAYIAAVAANTSSYTNSNLVTGTAYSYRVRALRGSDYSLYSEAALAVSK